MNGAAPLPENVCPVCMTAFYHTCASSPQCARGLCPVAHHCDSKQVLGSLANNPRIREEVNSAVELIRGLWDEFIEKDEPGALPEPSSIDVEGASVPEVPLPPGAKPPPVVPSAFCDQCGRAQTPTAKFCAGCGAKVTA